MSSVTGISSMISKLCENLGNILNHVDNYGSPIKMNFDGKHFLVNTSCGGIMTILLFVVSIIYSTV